MKRREFLKLSSVGAAALLAPSVLDAYEYPSYEGPLWIFVHAVGGWDPTMICNSQPSLNRLDAAKTTERAGNIEYVPINETVRTFFQTHHDNMLVINGVNAQSNNHSDRYFVSGQLEAGYPTFGSVLSEAYRKESPVGHIVSGGRYRYSAGLGSTVGVRSGGNIQDLIFYDSPLRVTKPTLSSSLNSRLELAKKARLERLLLKHKSKAVLKELEAYKQAHSSMTRLSDVVENLNKGDVQGSTAASQTHFGIAGFASNKMTLAINASQAGEGGFDNHGDMDTGHPPGLKNYFTFIQDIVDDAQAMGVWQDTVIVMFSEMGRTPEYNSIDGKDHWPVTSTILFGPRVQGNKVIGATTAALEPTKLNPETLELDENGKEITFADLNQLFRRYAKIENTPAALKYSLDATEFNLDAFFKV